MSRVSPRDGKVPLGEGQEGTPLRGRAGLARGHGDGGIHDFSCGRDVPVVRHRVTSIAIRAAGVYDPFITPPDPVDARRTTPEFRCSSFRAHQIWRSYERA
jgi:hypothetical protein